MGDGRTWTGLDDFFSSSVTQIQCRLQFSILFVRLLFEFFSEILTNAHTFSQIQFFSEVIENYHESFLYPTIPEKNNQTALLCDGPGGGLTLTCVEVAQLS